jgi:protein-S-isoprenylcysteine O-methyltransferase Ste14
VADEFRLLRDIDGIAGATVTSFAITRGVREAARRVAEAYNNFIPGNPVDRARSERVLEEMRQYSWQDLIDQGVVKQLVMPVPGGSQLELTFTYLGHAALGEFFIGRTAYARAERDASSRLGGAQMMLLAVGGEALADHQLHAHRRDPAQHGRTCRRGLWAWSRHPNYFFEWLTWCGIALVAAPAAGWWAALQPVAMFVLVRFVSGVPYTELQALKSRGDDYRRYQQETNAFVPWWPRRGDAP